MARASRALLLIALFGSSRAFADDAQMPYADPRETLIPGNPGMPGGIHVMVNAFAHLESTGLGQTVPLLTDDWAMIYGRDKRGWIEGTLMLDFEPFTVGAAGYPEIGQSGEGLWDAQHAHQFLHQAMIAVHPFANVWGPGAQHDLSIFAGQGSATIGPPIFMHRASSPGPTVPRKHHKGENPHETFPVVGMSYRENDTTFEFSAFSALELTPEDSRFHPYVAAPVSGAARVRHVINHFLELQISGEHLHDQGPNISDTSQLSASAYLWKEVKRWRMDALLDYALDAPDVGDASQAVLTEFALRSPNRRETAWLRSEFNQREEQNGTVSSPWFFQTVGYEHVLFVTAGLQLGLFAEATAIAIPSSLQSFYGHDAALTVNVGLHLFGMWMSMPGMKM
jgi:hypothetical protein